MPTTETGRCILLIVLAAFSLFLSLGNAPLFDKDEGAFCEATREMMVSGNYLMPYLNGSPRYDKPILIYWCQAASAAVFGLNEFGMRFPSALAALVWMFAAYGFTRRNFDSEKAFLAALFLLTSVQVTIIAKAAIADALLNCFIAIAGFALYRFHESRAKGPLRLASLALALGMLTKGPVALMVPIAPLLLLWACRGELKRGLRQAMDPIAGAIFLLVAAPWYVFAILDQGRPILEAWILKHLIGRLHAPMEGHGGSLFYYVPVLLIGVLPYTALALRTLRGELPPVLAPAAGKLAGLLHGVLPFGFLARMKSRGEAAGRVPQEPLRLYLTLWFVFTFVFFSFSGTKLPHYIVYGYTPLFILMADWEAGFRGRIALLAPLWAFFGVFLVLPLAAPHVVPVVKDEFARLVILDALDAFGTLYYASLAGALALSIGLMALPEGRRRLRMLLAGTAVCLVVNFTLAPTVGKITQEPIRQAAAVAREKNLDVAMWKFNMPSFIFYFGRLVNDEMPRPGEAVLTKASRREQLGPVEVHYEKNGVLLATPVGPREVDE